MTAVTCETREADIVGVKLLLASLARHWPGGRVRAHLGPALYGQHTAALRAINPSAECAPYDGPQDWSCKAEVILAELSAAGGGRVVWLDSDTIATGPLAPLGAVPPEVVVVAQEANPNDNGLVAPRLEALGLGAGAPRATTVSSCVVGVTPRHQPLIERWRGAIRTEAFLREQALPPARRRLFYGDQEALEAVLCSPEYAATPIHWLRNDRELVQGTYTAYRCPVPDAGRPGAAMLAHAVGGLKPWRPGALRLTQELFPYFRAAQDYLGALDPAERDHFRARSVAAALWARLGGGFATYRRSRLALNRLRETLGR